MPITRVDSTNGSQKEELNYRVIAGLDGKKIKIRRISPSKEALEELKKRRKISIIGHLAINPRPIARKLIPQVAEIVRKMAVMDKIELQNFIDLGPVDFVENKVGLKKFRIKCATCGDDIAYCWAENDKLDNWCDLHYLSWYDKFSWRGCFVVNLSPVDGKLGFECVCGENTCEFRSNTSLPPIARQLMVEYSLKHRDFGNSESKFIAIEIKD